MNDIPREKYVCTARGKIKFSFALLHSFMPSLLCCSTPSLLPHVLGRIELDMFPPVQGPKRVEMNSRCGLYHIGTYKKKHDLEHRDYEISETKNTYLSKWGR
jgi:hypothetical protein